MFLNLLADSQHVGWGQPWINSLDEEARPDGICNWFQGRNLLFLSPLKTIVSFKTELLILTSWGLVNVEANHSATSAPISSSISGLFTVTIGTLLFSVWAFRSSSSLVRIPFICFNLPRRTRGSIPSSMSPLMISETLKVLEISFYENDECWLKILTYLMLLHSDQLPRQEVSWFCYTFNDLLLIKIFKIPMPTRSKRYYITHHISIKSVRKLKQG